MGLSITAHSRTLLSALREAYQSGQLITVAECDARVDKATNSLENELSKLHDALIGLNGPDWRDMWEFGPTDERSVCPDCEDTYLVIGGSGGVETCAACTVVRSAALEPKP